MQMYAPGRLFIARTVHQCLRLQYNNNHFCVILSHYNKVKDGRDFLVRVCVRETTTTTKKQLLVCKMSHANLMANRTT